MATLQSSQEKMQAARAIFDAAASELARGASKQEIVSKLVAHKMKKKIAIQFVDKVEQGINQAFTKKYKKHMIYGILWCIGGTLVTAITYSAASERGGTYVIAYGAVVFGAIDFFRGLFGWLKYKN